MYNHLNMMRRAYVIFSKNHNAWYNIKEGDGFVSSIWDATRFKNVDSAKMWCGEDEVIFVIKESINAERA